MSLPKADSLIVEWIFTSLVTKEAAVTGPSI